MKKSGFTSKAPSAKAKRSMSSRLLRWTCLFVVSGLFAGSLYVVWTNYRGTIAKERLNSELASRGIALEPKSYRWDTGDRKFEKDGTRYYLAAFELRPAEQYYLPAIGMANEPSHCEVINSKLTNEINKTIAKHADYFSMISKAQKYQTIQYREEYDYLLQPGMKVLSGTRSVARWLQLANLGAQGKGDHRLAVQRWNGINHVSDSLTSESLPITVLVQISIDALSDLVLEDMLSRSVLNESQLISINNRLSNRRKRIVLPSALENEISIINRALQDVYFYKARDYYAKQEMIRAMKYDFDAESDYESESNFTLIARRMWISVCPGWYELELSKYMEEAIGIYDAINLIDPQDIRSIYLLSQNEIVYRNQDLNVSGLLATIKAWSDYQIQLAVVSAAVEVETYRLTNDKWPEALDNIDGIPTDPMTGNTLGYQRTSEGVVIYSFGPNGQDDNGIEKYDDNAPEGADDIAFHLYDVDIRGNKSAQPWPEPKTNPDLQYQDY